MGEKDKDDKAVDQLFTKHLGSMLNDAVFGRAIANFKSDFIVLLLDARIDERMRATGEDKATAEGNVVANLAKPEEDRKLDEMQDCE